MEKPLEWIGSSKKDIRKFSKEVRIVMGYALDVAQNGGKADSVKPLKGIVTGSGVLEVIDDFDGDTYRAVYTVRFKEFIYVLHAFKKKSTKGINTPKPEIDLIKARYKEAESRYKAYLKKGN